MESLIVSTNIKIRGIPLPHLAAWRRYFGYSQRELAQKAGLYQQSIVKIEQGCGALPNTIEKLAAALDIPRQHLINSDPDKNSIQVINTDQSNTNQSQVLIEIGRFQLPYLRDWRLHKFMSMTKLGSKSGVTTHTISRLERNPKLSAMYSTAEKLARALGISLDRLVKNPPIPQRPGTPASKKRPPVMEHDSNLPSLSGSVIPGKESDILAVLEAGSKHIDEIYRLVDQEFTAVSSTLAIMEIKGLVRNIGGMYYEQAK